MNTKEPHRHGCSDAVGLLRRARSDYLLEDELARHALEEELSIDVQVAEAVIEVGSDLHEACIPVVRNASAE
ncbi:hypothetical protein [Longimicrobium terrae]|uniref:Putative translin family RNA/ssDNA-binding protein n=1 Tax=Longimicrobium terrae TaxID=1639882 RepID=A0A841H3I5_9BACT|nr:hypothetical protein [Longimicrobium terrae]MBB4638140.1 putative translin family RNA/ssDNA-binding protein [Longimicrobium terrae]MBB6072512.1 putative translin family RNA/ssDNA-binding protein [Longimicrobium terrae]NNC32078.1 hypothetical protein [Longimicrobium terrae]